MDDVIALYILQQYISSEYTKKIYILVGESNSTIKYYVMQ